MSNLRLFLFLQMHDKLFGKADKKSTVKATASIPNDSSDSE